MGVVRVRFREQGGVVINNNKMASPPGPKRPPPPRAFSEPARMGQQAPFTVDVRELEAARIRFA